MCAQVREPPPSVGPGAGAGRGRHRRGRAMAGAGRRMAWALLVVGALARGVYAGPLRLVEELLMSIGAGEASVTKMGSLAQAITAEATGFGGDLQALTEFVGHNAERDLQRWCRRQHWRSLLPDLYHFPMVKDGRGGVGRVDATRWALLPHEVFGQLHTAGREVFEYLFSQGTQNLEQWWREADALGGEWYENHPVIPQVPAAQRIPLGFHGDDAGAHGNDKVLVVTWGSVAVRLATLDTRIVFSMMKDSETWAPDSLHTLYTVLAWSFRALADGHYPSEDHEGKPFGQDHEPKRAKLAGRPLTSEGHRGVWAEMRGDWKFLKEALHLREHYGRPWLCHLCRAHKRIPGLSYTDFRREARHRRTRLTSAEWLMLALAAALVSPLLATPGFAVVRVLFDVMHCLDLGVYQVAIPSALAELTERPDVFDGPTLEQRLRQATRAYKTWCRENKVVSVARKLTKAWVEGPYPG